MASIYVPDILLTSTHRQPPPPREAVTQWNGRDLDEHEQQRVAEGLARGDQHGLDLLAGRTT